MQIFPNAVGDIDARALGEAEFSRSRGHVPANGAGRGSAFVLRKLEAEVAIFHEARRREQADVARDEDGFGIAVAQRLKLAQPPGKHRSDLMQRQARRGC